MNAARTPLGLAFSMRLFATLGLGALVAGCSSTTPPPMTMTITPSGGAVSLADGTAVSIPAGALTASTAITLATQPSTPVIDGSVLVGSVYRFGPEGTQFAAPVTVTLAYDPQKLPNGAAASDVVIFTAPAGSSSFTALATSVVDATHVSATTTHFSDFVAAVKNKVETPDMVVAAGDLSTSDMASSCARQFLQGCVVTGCGANALYMLNCAQAMCQCSHGNLGSTFVAKPAPYTNTTTCPPVDVLTSIWVSSCMFPQ
jgi:hypothetical protein